LQNASAVIALDVRPSGRAQAVAAVALAVAVAAILLLPGVGLAWRVAAAGALVVLAGRTWKESIFGLGPTAVRRIEWTPEGGMRAWVLVDRCGVRRQVRLSPASLVLGSWMLLVWVGPDGSRFRALVDAACTDRCAYRALKGRLRLGGS